MAAIAAERRNGTLVEPVSPELALVDPELRDRARAVLPLPVERPAAVRVAVVPPAPPAPAAAPRDAAPPRERSCVVPSLLAGLAGALVVALAATFSGPPDYRLPAVPSGGGAPLEPSLPGGTDATAPAPAPPTGPAASVPARRPAPLSWQAVPGAAAYEVVVRRGSRIVLVARTGEPRLVLPARWRFDGRELALEPGVYRWSAWATNAGEPGRPAGAGTLVVRLAVT